MAYETVDLKLATTVPNPTGYKAAQDELIGGDPNAGAGTKLPANGGVRFLFDLEFPLSNANAPANPANGNVIGDMSQNGNGTAVVTGVAPAYAGGGFDFAATTDRPTLVRSPITTLDPLLTDQFFAIVGYFKLPAEVDWPATSVLPIIWPNGAGAAYPARCYMRTLSGVKSLQMFRPYDASSTNLIDVPVTGHFGQVAQILMYRSAIEVGFRLKTTAGEVSATPIATGTAAGAKNTNSWAGTAAEWGISPLNWPTPLSGESLNANNFRLYRGYVENLALSGRAPVPVADEDWARTIARGVFA